MITAFCKWCWGLFKAKPPVCFAINRSENSKTLPNKSLLDYTNAELVARYGEGFNKPPVHRVTPTGIFMDRKSFFTHPKLQYQLDVAKEMMEIDTNERCK